MKKLQFKTNINCGGCVATVTPFLEKGKSIAHWEVDTNHPEKTLTVSGEAVSEAEVCALVREAGFKIEPK